MAGYNNLIRSVRPNYAILLEKQLHLVLAEGGDEHYRHGFKVGSDGDQ